MLKNYNNNVETMFLYKQFNFDEFYIMDIILDREKNETEQGLIQFDNSWTCPVCTFVNDEKSNVCSMCGNERDN